MRVNKETNVLMGCLFVTDVGSDGFPTSAVVAFHEGHEKLQGIVVPVLSQSQHRGAVTYHMSVDCEFPRHGAAEGGVVRKEVDVAYLSREFLIKCELDIDEGGFVFCGTINPPRLKRRGQGGCHVWWYVKGVYECVCFWYTCAFVLRLVYL
jgi:hypothetical protein